MHGTIATKHFPTKVGKRRLGRRAATARNAMPSLSSHGDSTHRTSIRCLAALTALGVFLAVRSASAAPNADLYTIGPGSDATARYGHSLVCLADDTNETGQCYDYGYPDRQELLHMAWTAFRGQPSFIAVRLPLPVALGVFETEGRDIERQRLPLDEAQARALSARLEADVRNRFAYAYHPYFANCTTLLRDRINEAMGGTLRAANDSKGTKTFRQLAEHGFSGRIVELAVLALSVGSPHSDRLPTSWERTFLPGGLRDYVEQRFGVAPKSVVRHDVGRLPTSPIVGRVALSCCGALLALLLWWYGVRRQRSWPLRVTAFSLATLALVPWGLAVFCVWPELRFNWVLAVLWPIDAALAFLPLRWFRLYTRARVAGLAVILLVYVSGVIRQPILAVILLALLPFVVLLCFSKRIAPAQTLSSLPGPETKAPEGKVRTNARAFAEFTQATRS